MQKWHVYQTFDAVTQFQQSFEGQNVLTLAMRIQALAIVSC